MNSIDHRLASRALTGDSQTLSSLPDSSANSLPQEALTLDPDATSTGWKSAVSGNWNTAADWSGGTVPGASADATIAVAGTYTVSITATAAAQALLLDAGSASVADSGALSLSGSLSIEAGTFTLASGGTITGGTISTPGSGVFLSSGGTLSDVTYLGTLNIVGTTTALSIYDSLRISAGGAPGLINVTGSTFGICKLDLIDTQTLNDATVNLDYSSLDCVANNSGANTFTLGSQLNIISTGYQDGIDATGSNSTLVNQGTITAEGSTGTLYIDATNFINAGSLIATDDGTLLLQANMAAEDLGDFSASSGGVIEFGGIVGLSALLNNAGNTLTLGGSRQLTLGAGGVINGGTISDSGGGLNSIGGSLIGVTYLGTLNLSVNRSILHIYDGITVASGVIDTGANSDLYLDGGQTLDNATVTLGTLGSAGLDCQDGNSITGTYIFGTNLGIISGAPNVQIDYNDSGLGDTLINEGTITANHSGGYLYIFDTSAAANLGGKVGVFTNTGTLAASNGASFNMTGAIDFGNFSAGTLTGGSYIIGANSWLDFNNEQEITTLAASVSLSGTGSAVDFLYPVTIGSSTQSYTTLDATLDVISHAGTLSLSDARNFIATANSGTFTDGGTLSLAGDTFTATSLITTSDGSISGYGTIAAPVSNDGLITAAGGTLVLAGAVSGTGNLAANFGATLDIALGGTLSSQYTGAGTLELGGASVLRTTAPKIDIKIDSAASLSGAGTLADTVVNAGLLDAASGTLRLDAAVTSSGTLSAGTGAVLSLADGGVVSGILSGTGTIAIGFGTRLSGTVDLSASHIIDTANIAVSSGTTITEAASSIFTITAKTALGFGGGASSSFENAGMLLANGAGTVTESTASFANTGQVTVSSGTLSFLDGATNTGSMSATSGLLTIAKTVSGTGSLLIGTTGTIALGDGAASGQIADFVYGTGGILDLTDPNAFDGKIIGFRGSDTIDLFNTAETSFSYSGGVLTVKDGNTTVAALHFGAGYVQQDFLLNPDQHNGTVIKFG